jgi:hypothetical protein
MNGGREEIPDAVDDNRAEQLAQSAPALPLYLAEKFFWKQSGGGRFYLSPIPTYLAYVEASAANAANYGLGKIYPNGEDDVTEEAGTVERMGDEARDLLESFRALGDNEAKSFERFLIDRATRNAVYAATTQYELENWTRRAASQDQDASAHQNFGEKQSRLESFALMAGISYALVRAVMPSADLSDRAYAKAARRIVYDSANFETNRQLNPTQLGGQQTAATEAALLTVTRF